jgi:hypothetical protein
MLRPDTLAEGVGFETQVRYQQDLCSRDAVWRPTESDWMSPFAEHRLAFALKPRLPASVRRTDNGLPKRFAPSVTAGCQNANEERRLAMLELAADHAPNSNIFFGEFMVSLAFARFQMI